MKSAYATRLKSLSPEVHVLPIHLSNGKTSSPTVKCLQNRKKKKKKSNKIIYTHLYAYMSGPLSVLFGFLSTPSQKWQTECSQCLNQL